MEYGISGAPLPAGFPCGSIIADACESAGFFPLVVGAIKMNETGWSTNADELQIGADATTLLLPDGSRAGVGLMQLTSSYPDNWRDPLATFLYAIHHFLIPALDAWKNDLQGDDLVRAMAATYNGGLGAAEDGHAQGDLDLFTTDHYAQRALTHYHALLKGVIE